MSEAHWRPLYDLYASSQDGKPSTSVSLHYRVNLSQGTGEDWNDAKLILSTSETNILDAGVPTSDGLVIEPIPKLPSVRSLSPSPPRRARRGRRKTVARMRIDMESELSNSDSDDYAEEFYDPGTPVFLAGVREGRVLEGGAIISKTPMAVSYTVDELTTIPSDSRSHKVLVAVVPFEATISHITTPRKSPLAYLQVCPPPVSVYHPAYRPWCIVLGEEYQ